MQAVFNEYINYLETERNSSPYTVRNYTTDLLDFFQFIKNKGIGSLKEVDKHTLRSYLSYLMDQGVPVNGPHDLRSIRDSAPVVVECKLVFA